MFEDVEKKILEDKKTDAIKDCMEEVLPILYNAVYRSSSAIAMETKIAIVNAREELRHWIESNQDKIAECRSVFQEILDRYKGMESRIKKLKNE